MEILSYPVGLLIGLFPVIVDLGPSSKPAELLLDGVPTCTISPRAPGCTVDLGANPVIHLMELVRKDPAGRVTERVSRWINKPGVEAEVHVGGECERKSRSCDFTLTWAHPAKQDPASVTIALDGTTISRAVTNKLRVPFPGPATPQVVTVDAVFPDGRRAAYTRLLHGSYPEAAEASLQAVPIVVQNGARDEDLEKVLKEEGWPVRAVEHGEFEVVFVVEPGALESMSSFGLSRQSTPLASGGEIRAIVANDTITAFLLQGATASPASTAPNGSSAPYWARDLSQYGSRAAAPPRNPVGSWIRGLFRAPGSVPNTHRMRTADAVAAAGYSLGGSSRRRAAVLIAGTGREDESTFSPEQARAYLGQTQVPLFVWRKDLRSASEWGGGSGPLLSKFGFNIAELRRELDRQRIVWLEGRVDPREFHPRLPAGIAIAGRFEPEGKSPERAGAGRRRAPESDAVFAVTADPSAPGTVYAGSRAGLRVSRDAGEHWAPVKTGAEQGEVYAVAFAPGARDVFFGSSGAIGRSIGGGESWALAPTLSVFSILPSSKEVAFAATRGGIYRTVDAGTRWVPSEAGMEKTFAFSLAADPRNPDVLYSATAGNGVFKSTDRGQSWKPAGRELEHTAVRSIAIDPANADAIYVGTDGGVFASSDAAGSWQRRSSGLPRAVVYALLADSSAPGRILAGTAAGLFESRNGAKSWNRFPRSDPDIQVTSLALDRSAGKLYVATIESGVIALDAR